MKSLKTISLATIGTLTIIGTSVLAATGTVNAPSGLVLREEASKTSNPIVEVPDKTEVNIIEKNEEWYKVTYSNHEGYLYAEYVNVEDEQKVETPTEPQEETTQTEQPTDNGTASKSKLKVYAIPVITSTVINEIEPSVEVTIEKQITNWSYISAGEINGWVRTYGIENTIQTNAEPTVEPPQEETEQEPEEVPQPEQSTVIEEPEEEKTTTTEPSDEPQTEQTLAETKGYVAVECANVRKEPATNAEIVTALTKDTSFTITAETEEWYKIKYTSLDDVIYEGYIFKNLVTK